MSGRASGSAPGPELESRLQAAGRIGRRSCPGATMAQASSGLRLERCTSRASRRPGRTRHVRGSGMGTIVAESHQKMASPVRIDHRGCPESRLEPLPGLKDTGGVNCSTSSKTRRHRRSEGSSGDPKVAATTWTHALSVATTPPYLPTRYRVSRNPGFRIRIRAASRFPRASPREIMISDFHCATGNDLRDSAQSIIGGC